MGVTLFIAFLLLLLALGILLVLAGLALSLFQRRKGEKSRRGRSLLALGAGLAALPLAWFLIMRLANMTYMGQALVTDTGRYVEEETWDSFTVEGTLYHRLDLGTAQRLPQGEPAFTYDGTDYSFSLSTLLFGRYYHRGNYCAVPNGAGVDLYTRDSGGGLYCPANQVDRAMVWYEDPGNYDWYVSFALGEEKQILDPQPEREITDALLSWQALTQEETDHFFQEHSTSDYPALQRKLPLEDSQLGAVLAFLEKDQHPETAVTLSRISRDGVVSRDGISLSAYHDRLWDEGVIGSSSEGGNAYQLFPLPQNLEPFFSNLLTTKKGTETP